MPDKNQTPERLPTPGEIADDHDRLLSPKELAALFAEWRHDYGLRRMEERGVKYEDEAIGEERSMPTTPNTQSLPSPGQIGNQNIDGRPDPQGPDYDRSR